MVPVIYHSDGLVTQAKAAWGTSHKACFSPKEPGPAGLGVLFVWPSDFTCLTWENGSKTITPVPGWLLYARFRLQTENPITNQL